MPRKTSLVAAAAAFAVVLDLPLRASGREALHLDALFAHAAPSADELALAAELATAQSELAGTSARLAGGPTIAAALGPRRVADATRGDVALDIDLPLLSPGPERAAALDALTAAERLLPAAARLDTHNRLAQAYVAAWAAERRVELHSTDVATTRRWLGIAERRFAQGASAAFEVDLLALELAQAEGALVAAGADRALRRRELALRTTLPSALDAGVPLVEPAPPQLAPAALAAPSAGFLPIRAARARGELATARARLDHARARSRWALRSGVASEADESVARIGLSWRWPLAAERESALRARDAAIAAAARAAVEATMALEARFEAARVRRDLEPPTAAEPARFERTLAALELRLLEGKSTPAEALAARRTVLASEISAIDRRAASLAAAWELAALSTSEEMP